MYKPEGILTSLVTPFDKDGNVDEAALREMLEFQCNSKASGISVAANTGEFTNLTTEEVMKLTDISVEAVKGRKKVIIGALAPSMYTNLEIAKHAKEAGADAILLSPPYYITATDDGLYEYFRRIGEVGIPFIIFNIPERCPCNLMPPLIERLMTIDTFVGIKECDPSFPRVEKKLFFINGRISYLMGFVTLALPHFLLGGVGGFFSAGCFAPDILADLYTEAKAGHIEKAIELHKKVLQINDATMTANHPAGVKAAATLCGLHGGYTRAPLGQCTEAEVENIRKTLKEIGMVQ